jgi:ABC-type uncharacterized transport system YnjBCD substrate-binding protein
MTTAGYKPIAAMLLISLTCVVPGVSYAQITPDIVEAAKKEGEVMFYGAITINSSKAIGDLFEKKYGIKLRHWRGDATELINRSLAEARAGKPAFDVTLGNEVVMTTLNGKNIFATFDPPAAKGYPKPFRQAEHKMTPWRVLPTGSTITTNFSRRRRCPKVGKNC